MTFWDRRFTTLLLLLCSILSAMMVILMHRWNMGPELVSWAQTTAAGFSGALLRDLISDHLSAIAPAGGTDVQKK